MESARIKQVSGFFNNKKLGGAAMHILLVDDHTLFREALMHVLNQLDNDVIIREASNAEEAAQLVVRSSNLDLILLDIDLPGVDGLTALPDLRELAPTVPIVLLSGSEASSHVSRAMENGAIGYIPKSSSSYEMLAALRLVMQGDIYLPPRLMGKLGTPLLSVSTVSDGFDPATSLLTTRQIEVLELMGQGLPNKSIARSLNIAEGTIKLHVAAILRVLGTRNRTEAVVQAARLGVIQTV
jgi:two-component system, NarL family, nitrate/nitrite response regulator NarL